MIQMWLMASDWLVMTYMRRRKEHTMYRLASSDSKCAHVNRGLTTANGHWNCGKMSCTAVEAKSTLHCMVMKDDGQALEDS